MKTENILNWDEEASGILLDILTQSWCSSWVLLWLKFSITGLLEYSAAVTEDKMYF